MTLRRTLVALALAHIPAIALAAPADDVKALLDQGRAAEAYALGKKHPEELGNPAFDFYFGVAAVDTGRAGEGVLALERYIANFPQNQTARLELARGYFVLGDDARAREEFDLVAKSNPPAGVMANIERFRDAIRAREARYQTTTGFFAEFGVGYDSNVNAGAPSANITLPVFGAVTLQSGVKTADSFATVAAGANVSHPLAPGLALFGSVNADGKFNRNDTAFDQANASAAGGLTWVQDKNLWRVTGSMSEFRVDYDRYRHAAGLTGELTHQLDELQSIGGFIQGAKFDYKGTNEPRNANFASAGAVWRRAFIGAWQPLLTLTGSVGEERNQRQRPDLGRTFWGVRAAAAVTPLPRWSAQVGASYQDSKYDAPDVLLGVVRKDRYASVDGMLSYAWDRNWSVRGEYVYAKNDSNLALYEFDRHVLALKVRYEFK